MTDGQRSGDPYRAVLEAALFAVEQSERTRRLGALDGLLKPWIRERLDGDLGLVYSADGLTELADDVSRILGRGYRYCELRKELSRDGSGPSLRSEDAVWRIVDEISWTKVFAVAVLASEQTAFALRRTVAPGRLGKGIAHWEFSAMPHQCFGVSADRREDFLVVVSDVGPDQRSGRAHVPDELSAHPVRLDQLARGFAALGQAVSLS